MSTLEKIEDQKGNVIYNHKVKKNRVFSPQTAYLTIDMMRDGIKYGTASSLKGCLNSQEFGQGKLVQRMTLKTLGLLLLTQKLLLVRGLAMTSQEV